MIRRVIYGVLLGIGYLPYFLVVRMPGILIQAVLDFCITPVVAVEIMRTEHPMSKHSIAPDHVLWRLRDWSQPPEAKPTGGELSEPAPQSEPDPQKPTVLLGANGGGSHRIIQRD